MPNVLCLLRPDLPYRRELFLTGLKAAGFKESSSFMGQPAPDDLLITWQRYGDGDEMARWFEKHGAAVIIVENGYCGHYDNDHGKPQNAAGEALYAMSLNRHGGAGSWPIGEPGRWREQGIELKPWRKTGRRIVIIQQRMIGTPPVASPLMWAEKLFERLSRESTRPLFVRVHPGNKPAVVPLMHDLEDAWAVCTWASSAGIRALAAGYPIFSDFRQWIAAPAARHRFEDIETPLCDDDARERAFDQIAWAQWSTSEIASGEPFRQLVALHHARKAAA